MPLNAGEMNRRITIQEKGPGQYGDGQPKEEWQDVVSGAWAKVIGKSGLGTILAANGDVPLSVSPYSFRIRYRLGLNAGMRILEHGPDGAPDETAPFDIKAVQMDKDRREWTDLVCELGANDG
jgi:SPP1 family predicted phage head-tail adaptor